MGGWIKVEKDLANDPRVLRMAVRLRNADVTLGSRSRVMVVGALVTLWWYADTHIREDDTLPIGADQIDEIVGIAGFCNLMPPEWLQVIDADCVKLIDYLTHNGTSEKKRALNQKRQQTYRKRQQSPSRKHNAPVTLPSRSSVTRTDQEQIKESPTPLGLDATAWQRWTDYRVGIGKRVKAVSVAAAQRKLAAFGTDQAAVVEQSIANGWQGLFALKREGEPRINGHGESAEVWQKLLASGGADPPRTPRIQAAIDACGGWSAIRGRTSFDEPKLKRHFAEVYERFG